MLHTTDYHKNLIRLPTIKLIAIGCILQMRSQSNVTKGLNTFLATD